MYEHPADISISSARSLSTAGSVDGDVTQSGQYLEQLSDEEFWQYARRLAQHVPAAAQPQEYLTCKLSKGNCLVPLSELYEIVRLPHHIALLPAIPAWMPCIVACRGDPIAVIDLNAYLSGSTRHLQDESMLLIANHIGLPFGLLVPAIGQIVLAQSEVLSPTVSVESLQQVAPWYLATRAPFVKGLHAEALVLNLPALLTAVAQQIEIAASNG